MLWATQGNCAKKKPPLHPINVNTASATELQQVPGIGPATAEKIPQARKSYGAFKSVNDLQAIKGIGPKKLDNMRRYLTVGKAGAPPSKSTSAKTQTAHGPAPTKAPPAASLQGSSKPAAKPAQTASEDEEQ